MGRASITGGVIPAGPARIQFDFRIAGQRFRPLNVSSSQPLHSCTKRKRLFAWT
jgi:hypothetical protein